MGRYIKVESFKVEVQGSRIEVDKKCIGYDDENKIFVLT
jgi:hypothetical protein